jgi:hypothetical protein
MDRAAKHVRLDAASSLHTPFHSGFALALALASFTALGCGRPFKVNTPAGFVELADPGSPYEYRAIAPEGVVVGVRDVDIDDKGDLAFWTKAVTLHFRQANGYALTASSEVRSADGTAGRELVFGHDESGKPYFYRIRLFVAQDRLFLVEAGGAKGPMTQYRNTVDWMLSTVRVRCKSWLAPVLASRTCNRW